MKHLNRFNENVSSKYIAVESVLDAFIEIDGLKVGELCDGWGVTELTIQKSNKIYNSNKNNIYEDYNTIGDQIKVNEDNIKVLQKIEHALEKLKIEYPSLIHGVLDYDESYDYILDYYKVKLIIND